MIRVRYSNIPPYLRASELCKGLDAGDESELSIPEECFKTNTDIDSEDDFRSMLYTIRYWILDYPPCEVLGYVFVNDVFAFQTTKPELWSLFRSFAFSTDFLTMKKMEITSRVEFAAKHCHSLLVEYLYELGHQLPSGLCTTVAGTGSFNLLKFCHLRGCELTTQAAELAVKKGRVNFLEYFHSSGFLFSDSLAVLAAQHNQLTCLKFLVNSAHVQLSSSVSWAAAANGHFKCLVFAVESGSPMSATIAEVAVVDPQCLRYVVSRGAALTTTVATRACAGGYYVSLGYLVGQKCPFDEGACIAAAKFGKLDCLRFAVHSGAPLSEGVCAWAAHEGHLHCLRLARELGCPWSETTLSFAVWNRRVKCVQYAVDNHCPRENHQQALSCIVWMQVLLILSCVLPYGAWICYLIMGTCFGTLLIYLFMVYGALLLHWHSDALENTVSVIFLTTILYTAGYCLYITAVLAAAVFHFLNNKFMFWLV